MLLVQDDLIKESFDLVVCQASPPSLVRAAMKSLGCSLGRALMEAGMGPGILAPILRAALPLCDGIAEVIDWAPYVHLGFRRHGSPPIAKPYFIPDSIVWGNSSVTIVDFALATGGTAIAAVDAIPIPDERKSIACAVAAPEGLDRLAQEHPDVSIILGILADGVSNDSHYMIEPWRVDYGYAAFGV